jgi:nicotinamidase/pyrazinamidase
MPTRFILVDVDTQIDFMEPTGALYVPGAELLTERLEALVAFAAKVGAPHLATMDTHTPDDPEFAAYGFPAHCVKGTPGWAKVAATRPVAPVLVQAEDALALGRELVFLKDTFDLFSNPLFSAALAHHQPETALVCGVATDYCVKAAVLGLLAAGVPVILATDAIASVAPDTGDAALAELAAAGARLMTVATAIAHLTPEAAHVA